MKRMCILVAALVCTAITSGHAAAGEARFSLNLDFNAPSDFSSGGTWTVVAKVDDFGLAGTVLQLADTNFDEVTGFLAPPEYEFRLALDYGGGLNSVAIGDDLNSGTHLLGIGVIGSGWPSTYIDDPDLVLFGMYPDLGAFTGGVSLATGSFAPGQVPDWAVDMPDLGDMTAAHLFGELGGAIAADAFVTVRYLDPTDIVLGDGNGDGNVDGLDYLIWAGAFGDDPSMDPPGSPENGDYNDDGVVDGLDYLTWAGNFGQGPNDATVVPEPASLSLLLLGCVAVTFRRRHVR